MKKADSIRESSLHYLSYRDRTAGEMREHLLKKQFSSADTEAEIEELKDAGYINDLRFALNYFIMSFDKNRGLGRIKRELLEKGVADFDIEDAAAAYEDEFDCDIMEKERELAARVGEKAMHGCEIDDKSLARLGRRLKSAGFGPDLIYETIGRYMKEKSNG